MPLFQLKKPRLLTAQLRAGSANAGLQLGQTALQGAGTDGSAFEGFEGQGALVRSEGAIQRIFANGLAESLLPMKMKQIEGREARVKDLQQVRIQR